MKTKFLVLLSILSGNLVSGQDLEGSWRLLAIDEQPIDEKTIRIYQDGYFASASWDTLSSGFKGAEGGEFELDEVYRETYDFNTRDTSLVGLPLEYEVEFEGDEMTLYAEDGTSYTWERISDESDDLEGNWVITGRKRNGEISRSTPGARRTIKILGGVRFQWVAFNSETKEFFGSGGGTYTSEDGSYVENLEFFSRDSTRVGARLPFQYELKEGQWHHSGKSSKGEPLYEIWSPYQEAYKE